MQEIIFKLKTPIKYHEKGQQADAYELIMRAPCMRQHRNVSALKQGFFKQVTSLQEKMKSQNVDSKINTNEELNAELLMNMLYSGGELNLNDYLNHFRELCLSGAVILPNEDKLIATHIDSLPIEEFERLAGEYILNFIIGSIFQKVSSTLNS